MTFSYQPQFPGLPVETKQPQKACEDVFHAYMTKGAKLESATGIPIMRSELTFPSSVLPFSEAVSAKANDYSSYVHFYEHDIKIERFWNSPQRYMDKLCKYAGFISPDYSTSPDMPIPLRMYNVYRNQLVGSWLQNLGYRTVCNVRCPAESDDYFLAGCPKNSLLAVGAVGCIKDRNSRGRFEGGIIRLVDELAPTGLVVVGEDAYGVFDYPKNKGIPIRFYHGATRERFKKAHDE